MKKEDFDTEMETKPVDDRRARTGRRGRQQ